MSDSEMSDGEKLATLREMLNREVRKREAAEMREVVLLAQREQLLAVARAVAEAPATVVYRGIDDTTHSLMSIVTRGKLGVIEQARAALAAETGKE